MMKAVILIVIILLVGCEQEFIPTLVTSECITPVENTIPVQECANIHMRIDRTVTEQEGNNFTETNLVCCSPGNCTVKSWIKYTLDPEMGIIRVVDYK